MARSAIYFLLISAFVLPAVRAQGSWTTNDIVMAEQASSFEISPDCRSAVWVKSVPDNEKDRSVSQIFLSSLTENKIVQLTRGSESSSSPKWSPDGKYIAFTASRAADKPKDGPAEQLWMISPFGGEPWRVTGLSREIDDYRWADADSIVFAAQEDPSFYEQREKKDDSVVVEDEGHEPPRRLFRYTISTGKVDRLTDNKDRITDLELSPDGRWALTIHEQSLRYEYDNRDRPLVFLYDLTTGERKPVFDAKEYNLRNIRWTPDSKGFYASSSFKPDPTYLWATVTRMYYFDLQTGRPTPVDLDWANGLAGTFAATDDGFVALLANGARSKFASYVRSGGTWRRTVISGDRMENIFGFSLGRDGKTIVYNYSTPSRPTQWYRGVLDEKTLGTEQLQITDLNKRFDSKRIARTELIHWPGALGEQVEGILYYPLNYKPGQKYPLVVMIHGGPELVDYDAWRETDHYPHNLYTQRGAFVLAPNYHGSSNYGLKWAESIGKGSYYDLEVPDIEKGVDHLIGRGMVDAEKLGVLGWSNGSLLTIALTTYTTRYKAAGAGAGVVDWTSDWATAYFGASFDNYYFGASPLEDPQRYVQKSPFYKLDRVRTPTIIFFGANDSTVAPSQGWMHYRALQQLGKTDVRFVMFPGEGHLPRKLSHQRRKIDEELAWFDKYLFKTYQPANEALKENSPLADALKLKNVRRDAGRYGILGTGVLVPETVDFKGLQIGRFEVTRAQFAQFDKTYVYPAGTDNYPANNISFDQARKYVAWLSKRTGDSYRLPNAEDAEKLYGNGESDENTLDRWAGYSLNPDDAERLVPVIAQLGPDAPLLKEVGSFRGMGSGELVFDLGGNVAEWTVGSTNAGVAAGGRADRAADAKAKYKQTADLHYTGFRVVKDRDFK